MANRTISQINCKHFASVKMPGFENKRECVTCQKIFEMDRHREESG